jgi:hypothetical protein
MSATEVIIRLGAAALLTGYLLWRRHQRRLKPICEECPADPNWTGSAFDAAVVTPQIQRLRQDYVAAIHGPPHDLCRRRARLDSARQALGRLAYFRTARADAAEQEPAPAGPTDGDSGPRHDAAGQLAAQAA